MFVSGVNQSEVTSSMSPWIDQMEMQLPDSTNDHYPFQVSPMSSSSEGNGYSFFFYKIANKAQNIRCV